MSDVDLQAGCTITINNGVFSAGISNNCNTLGTTGTVSNQLILCGGNNITLSQSINNNSATITIIGGAGGAGGSFSGGMSDLGNTSGTSGIADRRLVFVGGNNITLSQSLDVANSSGTITFSCADTHAIQTGISGIAGSAASTVTNGTVQFANSNNISFGLNGSTMTASYELLSHNSVFHTGSIGAESQISFNTSTGHDHDGVDSKLIITPQIVDVALSGKEFTSIKAAVDSILDASVTKPYIVRVAPGVYTESPFTIDPYVTVKGAGWTSTIIVTNDNNNHFITGDQQAGIWDCAVTGPTGVGFAALDYSHTNAGAQFGPFWIVNVMIKKGNFGVRCAPTLALGVIHMFNVANWSSGTSQFNQFVRVAGFGTIVGVGCSYTCGGADSVDQIFVADGANSELILNFSSVRASVSIKTISGLYADNGGKIESIGLVLDGTTYGIHIGSSGANSIIRAQNVLIENGATATYDVYCQSASGTINVTGQMDSTKISLAAGATLDASYTDIIDGEFHVAKGGGDIPVYDYGKTAFWTGWKSGGSVTKGAGLNLNVALGSGYVNNTIKIDKVSWAPGSVLCTANSENYIYVTSTGVISIATTEPDILENILLAVAYTNATNVIFLSSNQIHLEEFVGQFATYLSNAIGPVTNADCVAQESAPPSKQIDVTSGSYYVDWVLENTTGATPITFTYWYRKAGGGWNFITAQTNIDSANYDDGSGTLQPITAGKYKKDLLFVSQNADGTDYHLVYGQTLFDSQIDAENGDNPVTLTMLMQNSLRIAGIVVDKDGTHILSVIDERPFLGQYAPTKHHNSLPGLQGGQSNQYYHLNQADYGFRNTTATSIYQLLANSTQSHNVTVGGNSTSAGAGYIQISTGTMLLAGGNNITLSQNGASITISGANVGGAQTGISGISASDTVYTSGTVQFTGSNMITVKSGANQSIIIDATQSLQTQSRFNATLGGNSTSAGAGYIQISSGVMTIAGGNNVTLSQDGNAFTISGANVGGAQTGISGISASDTVYTSGTVQFTGANMVTVKSGANQSIIIDATHPLQTFVGGIAGSNASTVTNGTVQFANGNNITFGLNGSTITASASVAAQTGISGLYATNIATTFNSGTVGFSGSNNITVSTAAQVIIISGANTHAQQTGISGIAGSNASTVTAGTVQFGNANNVTFGLNGSTITASASVAAQTGISGIAGSAASTVTNGTVQFANSNNISFGLNGSTMTASFSSTPQTFIAGVAGSNASTVTNGTVQFANGNNITFGLNGSTITASASVAAQTGISGLYATNIATTFNSGTVGFSGSNNITVSTAAQAIIISGANTHAQQTGISGIAGSNASTVTAGTVQFGNANNVTFGLNGSTITASASVAAQTGISGIAGSAASTVTNGTVQFANGNNITFGLNGSTMTASASYSAETFVAGIAGSAASTVTNGTVQFSNLNNVSFGLNGSTMTASIPAGATATGNLSGMAAAGIATTYTSGNVYLSAQANLTLATSVNGVSQYIQISANNPGAAAENNWITLAGNIAVGSNSSASGSTIQWSGGNNITLAGTNNSVVMISGPNTHGVQTGISSIGVVGSEVTFTSGNVIFSGSANITLSTSVNGASQYILISAPAGGGTTLSSYQPFPMGNTGTASVGMQTNTSGGQSLFPVTINEPVAAEYMGIIVSMSFVVGGTSSYRQTGTLNWGLYTRPTGANSTRMSLAGSSNFTYNVSFNNSTIGISYPTTTNAGAADYGYLLENSNGLNLSSGFTGMKLLLLKLNSTITPGAYWLGIHHRQSSSDFNSGIRMSMIGLANTLTALAPMGQFTTNYTTGTKIPLQVGGNWFLGAASYTVAGQTALTNDITMSQMTQNITMMPYLKFETRV